MRLKRYLVFWFGLLGAGCSLLTHFDESTCDLGAPIDQRCLPGFVCLVSTTADGGVCVAVDGGTLP